MGMDEVEMGCWGGMEWLASRAGAEGPSNGVISSVILPLVRQTHTHSHNPHVDKHSDTTLTYRHIFAYACIQPYSQHVP